METLSIIIVSAMIGFWIGNFQKSNQKEELEREQDRLDAESQLLQVYNARIAYLREYLLNEREIYLRKKVNAIKKGENFSRDLNIAMAQYDKEHYKKWRSANMVPPTYANDIDMYH